MPTETSQVSLAAALAEHAKQKGNLLTEEDSPHILVVGSSGTGKSRSIINLPPENTIIFNPEGKALPFQDAAKFKDRKLSGFTDTATIDRWFKIAKNDPAIKYIVYDSFTEYLQLLMVEARKIHKGYEIFNYYNAMIGNFLRELRQIKNKIVILTAIDELVKLEQDNGALLPARQCWVEGKVWSSQIESKFSIVLFTNVKVDNSKKPPEVAYQFMTKKDGITSAKSPEGLFDFYIPNDLKFVVDKVEKYFGIS